MGFLTGKQCAKLIQLDSHDSQFRNFIKILDQEPSRECMKIGVIYVDRG